MHLFENEWRIVLKLKKLLHEADCNSVKCAVLDFSTSTWQLNSEIDSSAGFTISFNQVSSTTDLNIWTPLRGYDWNTPHITAFSDAQNDFFILYIIPVLQRVQACKKNSLIITAHITQTIDGKIALKNGISQWIGNEADRIHTHRMRALCDGVMIGNKTAVIDKPSLNVRHVEGEHPIKIVVGNTKSEIHSLIKGGNLIIISNSLLYSNDPDVTNIVIDKPGRFSATELAKALIEINIRHLFVEGGANLISGLLSEEAIHVLQIHIAPVIFGSGKDAITLPEIDDLKKAISSSNVQFFKLDDQYLMQLNFQPK